MSKLLLLFLLLSPGATLSTAKVPLGLDWEKEFLHSIPEPADFRYWYGDVLWGKLIYLGTKDLFGAETELHLFFIRKRISSALLILGPDGIDEHTCLLRYKKIVSHLKLKYGEQTTVIVEKDPDIHDLVYNSPGDTVRVGLYTLKTIWFTEKYLVVAFLLGDEDGIYIEINYSLRGREKKDDKTQTLKSL